MFRTSLFIRPRSWLWLCHLIQALSFVDTLQCLTGKAYKIIMLGPTNKYSDCSNSHISVSLEGFSHDIVNYMYIGSTMVYKFLSSSGFHCYVVRKSSLIASV